ncbi:MAG: D-glycero-beta-D-manno-heptose-7-phosphate kinase [Candidatus Kapaibacterium sp.]
MHKFTLERAKDIIRQCNGRTIAVIGDVMLDRYFWGHVSRISPEAPVPVIDLERESFHLGGAANVAKNLKSLGLEPLLCGVVGDDTSGASFIDISKKVGINPRGLYMDTTRPTTVKTRIIGNNQQIVRLDREVRDSVSSEAEEFIIKALQSTPGLSGIIFEDYNKGTISSVLIREVITFARENNIPVFVDPKYDNFFNYKNVTVFKPNKKEAAQALGVEIRNREDILATGRSILEKTHCDNLLLTLGKDGMMLFESSGEYTQVPTIARHVADVSGAGDTAIATLAAAYSGGATIREAASLANFAAGVVCEQPGIVAIEPDQLYKSILNNNKRKP